MDEEKLWYFAYGSNMNPSTLSGWRKVAPSQSKAAIAKGYYLNFAVLGIPYREPSFASIGQRPILPDQPVVHGVVHHITRKDYDRIRSTEGGGGHEGVGYESKEIEVETLSGQILVASTLIYCSQSNHMFFPSARYLNLIEGGAAQFGVPEDYQKWLKSLPRYFPVPQTKRHWVGMTLFLWIVSVVRYPVNEVFKRGRRTGQRSPRVVYVTSSYIIRMLAHLYYYVFRPIFGPGVGEVVTRNDNKVD